MLAEATRLAALNPVERPLPKLCAILTDGRALYTGYNSRKTHPLQHRFNSPYKPHLHAELDAIRRAARVHGSNLKRFTLYVARVHRSTDVSALAKPCVGCQRAIMAFNIQQVEWTK